jgi:hypothetical protein
MLIENLNIALLIILGTIGLGALWCAILVVKVLLEENSLNEDQNYDRYYQKNK